MSSAAADVGKSTWRFYRKDFLCGGLFLLLVGAVYGYYLLTSGPVSAKHFEMFAAKQPSEWEARRSLGKAENERTITPKTGAKSSPPVPAPIQRALTWKLAEDHVGTMYFNIAGDFVRSEVKATPRQDR